MRHHYLGWLVPAVSLWFHLAPAASAAPEQAADWALIWVSNGKELPAPEIVKTGSVPELGTDLENREWLSVKTQNHEILFAESCDRRMLSDLFQMIDNIHTFLNGRSPIAPTGPIRTFLVPNQSVRSRCSAVAKAMRTGERGDIVTVMTSLMHEETHLFNFAYLKEKPQGWWAGEYFCQYFQGRAGIERRGEDCMAEIRRKLVDGPGCAFGKIDSGGKETFGEAFSALFFLEEEYGVEKMNALRAALLKHSRQAEPGAETASVCPV